MVIDIYGNLKNIWEWLVENRNYTEIKATIRCADTHMRRLDYLCSINLGEFKTH